MQQEAVVEDGDHLFISYASEDYDLAKWVALKLTSEGYKVWCDIFKLLGGESYPRDIDEALKTKTFRVIALLSKNSISKPHPISERTLALNIGKERKIDFLIPLNVGGLKAHEFDWMTAPITFIPFYDNWADGLKRLLKKLNDISAPKTQTNGKEIAASTYLAVDSILNREEIVCTNELPVLKIPSQFKVFKFTQFFSGRDIYDLSNIWAFWKKDDSAVISFTSPPKTQNNILHVKDVPIADSEVVLGIKSDHLIKALIKKSLCVFLHDKNLMRERVKDERSGRMVFRDYYFQLGLLEKDKIRYDDHGKKIPLLACGRKVRTKLDGTKDSFTHHLAPIFSVTNLEDGTYGVQIKIKVVILKEDGSQYSKFSYVSRRKRLCKIWFNHQWQTRTRAIANFLADGKDKIILGEDPSEQVVIDPQLIILKYPVSIKPEYDDKDNELLIETDEEGEDD